MAKKFGKILLATAAIGSAAAAAYYFMRKKNSALSEADILDEDYDDFSDESLDEEEEASRSYVSLTPSPTEEASKEADEEYSFTEAALDDLEPAEDFTPLTETVAQKLDETVEEFLGDETSEEDELL